MTDLLSLAISLTLSCVAVLSVLFSTEGKGRAYLAGMGVLWVVVLLAAASAWTAVAGRVPLAIVHQITGWYWWLLPAYCGYISYENYRKKEPSARQLTRIKLICALISCLLLIALVASLWPANLAPTVERVEQNQKAEMKADTALADSLKRIDAKVTEAARLDSAQNDSLQRLHSQLLDQGKATAAEVASLNAKLSTPTTHATPAKTDTVSAAAPTRRERRNLRRAARRAARARRDSLRLAGME